MPHISDLSGDELRFQIKELEGQGSTGTTNLELHALNVEQTNRLSDEELLALLRSRAAQGKPIGKLIAAAQARGLSF